MIGTVIAGYQVVTINNVDKKLANVVNRMVAILMPVLMRQAPGFFRLLPCLDHLLYTSPTLP